MKFLCILFSVLVLSAGCNNSSGDKKNNEEDSAKNKTIEKEKEDPTRPKNEAELVLWNNKYGE